MNLATRDCILLSKWQFQCIWFLDVNIINFFNLLKKDTTFYRKKSWSPKPRALCNNFPVVLHFCGRLNRIARELPVNFKVMDALIHPKQCLVLNLQGIAPYLGAEKHFDYLRFKIVSFWFFRTTHELFPALCNTMYHSLSLSYFNWNVNYQNAAICCEILPVVLWSAETLIRRYSELGSLLLT